MSELSFGNDYLQLGNAVSICRGTINPSDFPDEEFQYFSLPSFDLLGGAENAKGSQIQSNKTLLQADCVLISKLNPRIPRVCKATLSPMSRSICSTEFIPLAVNDDFTSIEYLSHYLMSPDFQERFKAAAGGSTNSHSRVTPSEILDWHFYRPPLSEQIKIAEILSGIDNLLRLLQVSSNATQSDAAHSKVAKIKALKRAISSDLLSGRKRVSV